jgi:hypothetical protein
VRKLGRLKAESCCHVMMMGWVQTYGLFLLRSVDDDVAPR